jgi:hypothetical protein
MANTTFQYRELIARRLGLPPPPAWVVIVKRGDGLPRCPSAPLSNSGRRQVRGSATRISWQPL